MVPAEEEAAPTKVEVEPKGEKAKDTPVKDAVSDAELSIPSLVEDMKSVTTMEEAEDPPSESTPFITYRNLLAKLQGELKKYQRMQPSDLSWS